jgi:hypothetical protein
VGICEEVIGVVRFDGLSMFVMLVGLGFNNVRGFIRGDGVVCASTGSGYPAKKMRWFRWPNQHQL